MEEPGERPEDRHGRHRTAQIAAVAALDEPTRRQVYDHVAGLPEPASRDEVAASLGLPRTTAAFHLERLAGQGLLSVVFERRTGRNGPGAGRPAKLYRRSPCDVAVSLPERHYDLAGLLLADALTEAEHSGGSPRAALERRAHRLGREIAQAARPAAGGGRATGPGAEEPRGTERGDAAGAGGRDSRAAVLETLEAHGYEPCPEGGDVVLRNCPFHLLAQAHTELVCGMNLRLLDGVLEGLAPTGMTARLAPAPGLCCVRLRPAP
ncbi:helix-turn-helix transcriptional regulator [Planomonospora venezuelensis]|uniref:Putative ArsR family transcriptional regulator n=1 Tax=Planomonospora venezuelensis TaxID=1999 RepID=A0A841D525_PLAVE|nr:helix-turn-helix domain-containing protein [Planomonospora venezuelensis]MBB5965752.1 putative ArsR family transcriptional regulator [Planomonospora venezuelensis]GIN04406.1 transcriptional regulator [Planomonospora venezuelensis]